ncbi:methyltransferase type 11 [Halorubrum saccharovorum DSM 1137]|uniref:Methyltransferase type 11 n=1 Tax=Halorubrum saccharovorum DSM 1137 TaxID=1227484 RepID=M0E1Q8_9EURY|nr:class I SAM-dependent methyltransferase [Halorubrum saccharovorum]ELZ41706.1 methyltransferase type 11 [Halorubrum saccharovorum DSM 1137]
MGYHTFDAEKADRLERPAARYRWVSAEEVIGALTAERADREATTVADLGSGTGFYADAVAPHVETVYGVDVQAEMHAFYREKGVPENVELVESDVATLPFEDGELDAAFSTMTYHEFASDAAVAELARVLRSDGRLALFDWSAAGDGEHGPSTDERFDAGDAAAALEATGFEVLLASERTETFAVIARAP